MCVDLDVQVLGGGGAELLQDAADSLRDVVRHHLGKFHFAVDDHAALSEVQDLQVLESRQVGLQVRQQLQPAGREQSVWFRNLSSPVFSGFFFINLSPKIV